MGEITIVCVVLLVVTAFLIGHRSGYEAGMDTVQSVVDFTLLRSVNGTMTQPIPTDERDNLQDEIISKEFYAAHGFADIPDAPLVLERDETVMGRLRKEGL